MTHIANLPDARRKELDAWFNRRFDERMAEREAAKQPSMTIIATKGTLDMAYPPFILASTAAALGWEVSVFFTFYGLSLLKRNLDLKVTPLGNPAMPMKLPVGPGWLRGRELSLPTSFMALMPGFEGMARSMMRKTMDNKGIARIEELRALCLDADVRLIACQMTVDLFDYRKEQFIPEINEWVGAASFLPRAQAADVNLFM